MLVCWRASHWGVWVLAFGYGVVYVAGVVPNSPFKNHPMAWFLVLSLLWASLIWDGPEPAYLVFPMFFLAVLITGFPTLVKLTNPDTTGQAVTAAAVIYAVTLPRALP